MRRLLSLDLLLRSVLLVAGVFSTSAGMVLNLQANLGLAPWGSFQFGLYRQLGITLGEAALSVGVAMILISWLSGIPPGVGTLANMLLGGFFIDRILDWQLVPPQSVLPTQLATLGLGIGVQALGTALSIRPGLGAGPRDSFMLALTCRLGWPVGTVRSAIEGIVLLRGWLLGGPIGLGTVVYMLGIGPAVQAAFRLLRVRSIRQTEAIQPPPTQPAEPSPAPRRSPR